MLEVLLVVNRKGLRKGQRLGDCHGAEERLLLRRLQGANDTGEVKVSLS